MPNSWKKESQGVGEKRARGASSHTAAHPLGVTFNGGQKTQHKIMSRKPRRYLPVSSSNCFEKSLIN